MSEYELTFLFMLGIACMVYVYGRSLAIGLHLLERLIRYRRKHWYDLGYARGHAEGDSWGRSQGQIQGSQLAAMDLSLRQPVAKTVSVVSSNPSSN